ncbi:hypothetical protein C1645_827747 [Glomus cerebriforme]|uniref:Uncharacterized protein n=1 Tax=Glomus cerebriforme TaxID=658196 RepID=A0A397SRD1_9GLOM|nr:hypothetical protein C1645_827747 [Glomus cerebriforme]
MSKKEHFLLDCNCRKILSYKKDCTLVPVVSTLVEQGPNDAQKKCSRKSFTSTKKSSSKKMKKTENLEEANESATSVFLQLSNKIDNAETKNEELKLDHDKDGSQALVKSEVKEAIPKAKCSDEALRKRMERSEKIYKLFNSIGKEKITQLKSTPLDFILNLTKDEKDYVMAKILKRKFMV